MGGGELSFGCSDGSKSSKNCRIAIAAICSVTMLSAFALLTKLVLLRALGVTVSVTRTVEATVLVLDFLVIFTS
jgi:hypothetical protein